MEDEDSKVRRFIDGLIPPIQRMVPFKGVGTFREVVESAQILEDAHGKGREKQATHDYKRKGNIKQNKNFKKNQSSMTA